MRGMTQWCAILKGWIFAVVNDGLKCSIFIALGDSAQSIEFGLLGTFFISDEQNLGPHITPIFDFGKHNKCISLLQ